MTTITPVILSGGSGTRLWPLSRRTFPKQFLGLTGEKSLFQQTCQRVQSSKEFSDPMILANEAHRFIVAEQMSDIGIEPVSIVLEPAGRNTAPAALVAALLAVDQDPKSLILLLPSDHEVADHDAFTHAVSKGTAAAQNGNIVTFGVVPASPETGYGYIQTQGADAGGVLKVKRFVEKPDKQTAERLIKDASYLWNAGIFLASASHLVDLFKSHAPHLVEPCSNAIKDAYNDFGFLRLERGAYEQCENISLDYAILEKTPEIRCVPLDTGWSDLGSFKAIWETRDRDDGGNAIVGDVVVSDARNCLIDNDDGPMLAVAGVEDLVIAATTDAVLVVPRDKSEKVGDMVATLQKMQRPEAVIHNRVYRPWGWYEALNEGHRYQVKRLMVKPGARLSLQSHYHRTEHWVVVSGTARVTHNDKEVLLAENQSTYIPVGTRHRLENPGKVPLLVIEVQSGVYLGEDDIERFEDDFNRENNGD